MPDRNEYAPGVPSWVDLASPDLAKSKQFYSALFGWEFDDQPTDQGGVYSLAKLRDRSVVGLMETTEQPPAWASYVTVSDVDATVATVAGAGGTVFMPGMDVMDAGRMAVVADPNGAVICMWQAKNHIGSQVVNEPGAFTWNELITPDIDKSAAFYKKVFGWDAVPFEGMEYTVFNNNGEGIAGALPPPQEGIPSHWLVYFAVDDTDATVAKAKKNGATVMSEPFDVPTVGRIAVVTDPQGATFAVIKNAPQE